MSLPFVPVVFREKKKIEELEHRFVKTLIEGVTSDCHHKISRPLELRGLILLLGFQLFVRNCLTGSLLFGESTKEPERRDSTLR